MALDDLLGVFKDQKKFYENGVKEVERRKKLLLKQADKVIKEYIPKGAKIVTSAWVKKYLPDTAKQVIEDSYGSIDDFINESPLNVIVSRRIPKELKIIPQKLKPSTKLEPDYSNPLKPKFPRGYLKIEENLATAFKRHLQEKKTDTVRTEDAANDPTLQLLLSRRATYFPVKFFQDNNIKYERRKGGRKSKPKVASTKLEPDYSNPLKPKFPRGYLKDETNLANALNTHLKALGTDTVRADDGAKDPTLEKLVTYARLNHESDFYVRHKIKFIPKRRGRKSKSQILAEQKKEYASKVVAPLVLEQEFQDQYKIYSKDDLNAHIEAIKQEKEWTKMPRKANFQKEEIGYLVKFIEFYYGRFSHWIDEENVELHAKKSHASLWHNLRFAKSEAKEVMEQLGAKKMPSVEYLLTHNMKTFVSSAEFHYDSVKRLCETIGIPYDPSYVPPKRKKIRDGETINGSYKGAIHASADIPDADEDFIKDIRKYVVENGYRTIPSLPRLLADNKDIWLPAFRQLGGVAKVRAMLGYPPPTK